MEANKPKHIDLTYLKDLANGSTEFIVEIITGFLTETPRAIDNLEKHLSAANWDALRATAHKMKPSFSFVGIKELEAVINSVETNSAAKTNLDSLPEMISKIKTVFGEAVQELEIEKKNFS